MNFKDDVEAHERVITDTKMRILSIEFNIRILEEELTHLKLLQATLEENIDILKTEGVVAVSKQYSKSKRDLIKTKKRILDAEYGIAVSAGDLGEALTIRDKFVEAYDKLTKRENNVLNGDFGKKTDGKK